jgi:23S rRNA C2498 (ribose-2'-O)-methylase RlmM
MEKLRPKEKVTTIKVVDLLELIARCDAMIAKMLESGIAASSIMVRQELLIKHRYCEELNAIFKSFNAQIHIVEDELRQAA